MSYGLYRLCLGQTWSWLNFSEHYWLWPYCAGVVCRYSKPGEKCRHLSYLDISLIRYGNMQSIYEQRGPDNWGCTLRVCVLLNYMFTSWEKIVEGHPKILPPPSTYYLLSRHQDSLRMLDTMENTPPRQRHMYNYTTNHSKFGAGGSNFYVVRPNLVSVSCWGVACVSMLELRGSGGMLLQENFEIYSLRDCFR